MVGPWPAGSRRADGAFRSQPLRVYELQRQQTRIRVFGGGNDGTNEGETKITGPPVDLDSAGAGPNADLAVLATRPRWPDPPADRRDVGGLCLALCRPTGSLGMVDNQTLGEAITDLRRLLVRLERLVAHDGRPLDRMILDALADAGPLSTAALGRLIRRRRTDVLATARLLAATGKLARREERWEIPNE